jgi:acetyl esterase/lipase
MGFSAGGYLALMLGVTGPERRLRRRQGEPGRVARPGGRRLLRADGSQLTGASPPTAKEFVSCYLGGSGDGAKELAARRRRCRTSARAIARCWSSRGLATPSCRRRRCSQLMEKLSAAGVTGRVEFILGAEHGFQGADVRPRDEGDVGVPGREVEDDTVVICPPRSRAARRETG